MFFSLPTIALAASLLSSTGVLAVPHNGHRHLHAAKRDAVLVERKVTVVNTVTDWVTVWWDGTSYITTSATTANAIQTQAADAAQADAAAKAAAAAAQAPAPTTTAAPVAPAVAVVDTAAAEAAAAKAASESSASVAAQAAAESSASVAAQAAAESSASVAAQASAEASANAAASAAAEAASKAASNAASAAAAAAAAAAKNPDGIIDGIVSVVSSVVAPIIATPTPVVTPPTTGGPKRGLAYNNADLASSFTGAQLSWAYNWGSTTPSIPSSFEYVPMLWGVQDVHSGNWNEAASSAIASGSKHLLAFNEPDLPAQANLDPGAAAAGYKTFMQPFAGKAKLGSPAVTNGPAPMGIAFYQSFMAACDGCTVDFIPMHWYDSASNVEGFKKHVSDFNDVAGGRKLWITEFGASGSTEEQEEFLRQVIPWLDSQDYVERYAYFYADGVLTQNSVVSALGNLFMSYVS